MVTYGAIDSCIVNEHRPIELGESRRLEMLNLIEKKELSKVEQEMVVR